MNETIRKKKKWWEIVLTVLLCLCVFATSVLGILQLGEVYTERFWEYWSPDYAKEDILPILQKETLTDEDYQTLYKQTGLTKLGIDDCREKNDLKRVLDIQTFFFEEHEMTIEPFAPFTYLETIEEYATMAYLRDGDILVSATTRVSWWRYGHAALVVDGENSIIVESLSPGMNSKLSSARTFADLADFLILRPKADKEVRTEVAAYAKENLIGIPYQMTTGILTKKFEEGVTAPARSQCAHLVWYAYKKFGSDLDSNGGLIVKPQDIALSDQVEVVQAFGFDLDELWS